MGNTHTTRVLPAIQWAVVPVSEIGPGNVIAHRYLGEPPTGQAWAVVKAPRRFVRKDGRFEYVIVVQPAQRQGNGRWVYHTGLRSVRLVLSARSRVNVVTVKHRGQADVLPVIRHRDETFGRSAN